MLVYISACPRHCTFGVLCSTSDLTCYVYFSSDFTCSCLIFSPGQRRLPVTGRAGGKCVKSFDSCPLSLMITKRDCFSLLAADFSNFLLRPVASHAVPHHIQCDGPLLAQTVIALCWYTVVSVGYDWRPLS